MSGFSHVWVSSTKWELHVSMKQYELSLWLQASNVSKQNRIIEIFLLITLYLANSPWEVKGNERWLCSTHLSVTDPRTSSNKKHLPYIKSLSWWNRKGTPFDLAKSKILCMACKPDGKLKIFADCNTCAFKLVRWTKNAVFFCFFF